MEPARATERTETLIDGIWTNSEVIQSGAIETGLSDHELIYFSGKKSLLKLNEHYKVSIR